MKIIGLSRRSLGEGLNTLAATLLDTWLGNMLFEERDKALRSFAGRLAGLSLETVPAVKRLGQTIERLNELHYQARWEASALGPRVIMGHCPYTVIISDHPELCQIDLFLLEMILASSVVQTTKLQLNDKGLPFCAFQMMGSMGPHDPVLVTRQCK